MNNAYAAIVEELLSDCKPRKGRRSSNNKSDATTTLKVKEHSQCIVALGVDEIHRFLATCTKLYGSGLNQGQNGVKFSSGYTGLDPGDDQVLGTVHVTVYTTTGNVLSHECAIPTSHPSHPTTNDNYWDLPPTAPHGILIQGTYSSDWPGQTGGPIMQ